MDKTFLKGLILLEAMAKSERSCGVTELALELGLHKSNVHRLLQGLVHQGFARRDPETSRYMLTMKLWELGAKVSDRLDVRQEAYSVMQVLAKKTEETVHLSILEGVEVLYIDKIDSPQPIRAYTKIGGRAPAQCVATGKALLAWASKEIIEQVESCLEPYTPLSITTADALSAELKDIRANGFAINKGEWREEVGGIASPIFDVSGKAVAAIGISGPMVRCTQEWQEQTSQILIELSLTISRRLGFPGYP